VCIYFHNLLHEKTYHLTINVKFRIFENEQSSSMIKCKLNIKTQQQADLKAKRILHLMNATSYAIGDAVTKNLCNNVN